MSPEWLEKTLTHTGIAATGGALGYLMRSATKPSISRVLLEATGAAFVGYLIMLMCTAYNIPDEWTGIVAGVFGWLGANASIGVIERVVMSRLGIDKEAK